MSTRINPHRAGGFGNRSHPRLKVCPIADAGETCHWCEKPALRREIVASSYPRVYVGACRSHVPHLRPFQRTRAAGFTAKNLARDESITTYFDGLDGRRTHARRAIK